MPDHIDRHVIETGASGVKETVILVHGYFRTGRDMRQLHRLLEECGWRVITVTIPAIFGTLEDCRTALESVLAGDALHDGPVHLVGHSFGGLVIRDFLAKNRLPCPGRCVLIGTPNHGSRLADLGVRIFPPIAHILKPLRALTTNAPDIPPSLAPIAVGVIAGNRNRLLTGVFLPPESDGRVEVASTRFEGMTDFIVVPHVHTKIHRRPETARLVDRFLRTGRFGGDGLNLGQAG